MKNLLKHKSLWLLALIAFVSAVSFSSCDKDGNGNSSIVGSWTCGVHYYGGSDTYTFKKNGTYTWTYSGPSSYFQDETGRYTYNGVILTTSSNRGSTRAYVVIGLTKSSLVIMDEDGDSYTYYKN